jgi:type IV pilus assembly protein PilA
MSTFCTQCGNSLTADDKFCQKCGRAVTTGSGAPLGTVPPAAPAVPAETSTKAIISLVCGILFFIPLSFLAAIILGHMALSEIKRSAGRLKGEGLAIAGLVLGYMWVAGIPIILIVAAIAIPNLLRARIAANESSAVGGIRTLITAEVAYAAKHPDEGFTCSLRSLRDSESIDAGLASGEKSGYRFQLQDCSQEFGSANTRFRVVASPVVGNQTGIRAFCSDESAVIHADAGGLAQRCMAGPPLE